MIIASALVRSLVFAKTGKKWKLCKCRACSKEFHQSAECRKHLEQEHDTKVRTSVKDVVPQHLDDTWVKMISSGDWEPEDTEAAVEMMKNQVVGVDEFDYAHGWSKNWPLTNDYNRRFVLKEIHQTLMSLLEVKALSCSIRDWIMEEPVKRLAILGVPNSYLDNSTLVGTAQCICFLELGQLEQILRIVASIPTEVSKDLLTKAVDGYRAHSQIKEKINFDIEYSCLLLDGRLLKEKVGAFDHEGH